jgi:tetratricopeptide (TPR) repeat protein/TolB-like protein
MDCVMRSLGGRAGLSVVSRATIVPTIHALSRSFDAHSTTAADELGQEVARRLKARFLITGNIEALPMGIRVHCDLNDLRKGTLVQSWSRDLPQLDRDFYPAMESIASAVATQLGARAPGTPATTIAQQLTPSVAALRHYQAALDFLENRDVPSMIDELKKTTAIDSMFPEANLRLAQYSLGQDRRRYLGLAIAGKSVASPNTRDLIDVEDLTDRQQLDSAIVKCEQVLERDPEATAVGAQLAKLYLVKRRFRDAVAVCASVRMRSPFDYSFYPEWSFAYVEIGRSDKALGLLGDWRRQFPEEVGPIRYLVETHMNLGHYEAALSLCDTMDAIRPGSATGSRGFLMSFLGRMHDAESQFQQMASSPRPGTAAQGQKFLAMLAYQRHQYDRGMRFIRDRVGPGSSSYDLWIAGSLAAASGDVSRANEYANDIAQAFGASADTTTIEAYGDRRFYHHLRGLIALRMQHVNDATQAFERALRYAARVDGPFFSTDLAKAQMMAGHPAEAVRTLQRVIEFNPRYPEALLVLGQAYEQIGRVAEAHDVLMRLGTIWKDADSDYVLNVELRRLLHPGLAHRPSAKPYGDHPHTPDARGPSHAINDLGENALDPAERM